MTISSHGGFAIFTRLVSSNGSLSESDKETLRLPLAGRLEGLELAKAKQLYRRFIETAGSVAIVGDEIHFEMV